ncbi:hypothetical protein GCM10010145_47380 [Streptomyces ruber]|uniref:XRE family transcriptional regulator n=2 Tax=Streptomyces TaxID=1883 RepID=A0A918BK04_9ACTN|nr:hypothetical protein [Streptomyces ruber]GGQ72307.1 hypothetical protein GCM10010145_47380 [Streptomyces ruber]
MPNRQPQDAEHRPPVPAPGPGAGFDQRLNYLFDALRPRDGDRSKINTRTGEFSNAYVADTISGWGDGTITAAYIGKLRSPAGENPTIRIVRLLARFFEVPAGYFVEDEVTQSIVGQFQLVQQLRDQGVKQIAMRAAGLSPASKDALLKMVDAVRAAEGLPPATDDPDETP